MKLAQVHHGHAGFAGLTPGQGSAYWTVGMLMVVKVRSGDTAGRLSVCEFLCPPGYAVPLHIHRREDESFWVSEGRIRYRCGDEEFVAEPGAYVYLPLGLPHAFKVLSRENARLLHFAVPAGMEGFHTELGVAAPELVVPPPTPPDMPRVLEVGNRYGIEIVGPPIE